MEAEVEDKNEGEVHEDNEKYSELYGEEVEGEDETKKITRRMRKTKRMKRIRISMVIRVRMG